MGKLADLIPKLYSHFDGVPSSLLALFAMIALATAFELMCIGWRESSLRNILIYREGRGTDILMALLYHFKLLLPLGILMSGGLIYVLLKQIRVQLPHPLAWDLGHPVLSTLVFLIVLDFFRYWWHRAFHNVKVLWVLHRYHHSAPAMNFLNTFRVHPLEGAIGQLWLMFPLLFFGAPAPQVFAAQFLVSFHGLLCHSNIKSDWGWAGRWLVQSPAAHRIHHSTQESHYGKNLGSTLVVWDLLFGTFHWEKPEAVRAIVIGLDRQEVGQRPFRYVARVYLDFLIAVKTLAANMFRQQMQFWRRT